MVPLCALMTVAVLMFLLHAAVANVRPLTVTVRPQVSFAPAQIAIQIRLQPDPDDRWVNVVMDNGEYRRSSGFTIEPDRKLYLVSWPGVPTGDYVVVAAVGHAAVTRASDSARVVVNGP